MQVELLRTEEVALDFEPAALREIAKVATEANRLVENIGARRLHGVIERILEEISFEAPAKPPGTKITITPEMVREKVGGLLAAKDMQRHIL